MPREKKIDELRKWVQEYKVFFFAIDMHNYDVRLSVFAKDEIEANTIAEKEWPNPKERKLLFASNRVAV